MQPLMAWFGIDLNTIRRYVCTANRCCILRADPTIQHLFSELSGIFEVVRHGMSREDAKKYIDLLGRYHHTGFETIFPDLPE